MKIGIIGAGRMAQSIGGLAVRAGHEVMLSNSRGPDSLHAISRTIGSLAGTVEEAAEFGELIIIAIYVQAFRIVPQTPIIGKTILNPQNYFPQLGRVEELERGEITTAELLARHLVKSRVVKVLNSILVEDVIPDARPSDAPDRRAIPMAGDDSDAKAATSRFLDQIGYDAVDAGVLYEGWRFERRRPVYCQSLSKSELQAKLLTTAWDDWVPEGHWYAQRLQKSKP